jgi:sterol 3beta-glucosyltransferase
MIKHKTVSILTSGSRGDTQPYIALGVQLKKLGFHVRLTAFEVYKDLVEGYGLEFCAKSGDVQRVMASQIGQEAMRADNPLKMMLSFSKLRVYVARMQEDLFDACRGADLIIFHPGAPIGHFAAQEFGIPSIFASPFPMTPTREFPSLIIYGRGSFGQSLNLFSHHVLEQVMWSASRGAIKDFWKKRGLKIPDDLQNPYSRHITPKSPTFISCSNYVFPRPKDWPQAVHCEGYWFLDELGTWTPPERLQEFIARGEKPVFIGFGSLGNRADVRQAAQISIEAIKLSGMRAVLSLGRLSEDTIGDLPKSVFLLESAPHSWLFPKMSAVVHHGGAGTTAEGLRAGIPSIIVPHSNDQFAWGRRVYELQAGPLPIPRKKLTVERLADALRESQSPKIKAAAALLGQNIADERGAQKMAEIVAGMFAGSSKPAE